MKPVFISYSRKDLSFVNRLRADLQANGVNVWIDQTGLKPGTCDWEQALRDAIRNARAVVLVASPHSRQSQPVKGELAIADMYQRPVFPVWARGDEWAESIALDRITMQYVDARGEDYDSAIPKLVEALGQVPVVIEPPEPDITPDFEPRNPYKGLRAFHEGDRGDFFGRETLIGELVEALRERLSHDRLLAVIGPSGSGKSSVVMAGLLPRLRGGILPGSAEWEYLDPIMPGARPVESLCTTLATALPRKANTAIWQDLNDRDGRGLHLLGCQITRGANKQMVLLIDQFEELFTQTTDDDERRQFITLLVTAVTVTKGPVIAILTLRADFYDRPMEYPALFDLLQSHQAVPPMSIDDLRDVIERPAALPDVRLTFDEGLVGDLLFEVRGRVGGLPLLQFTLDQLFQQRDNHRLTQTAYHEIGGLHGALARHAEETYEDLPTDEHRKLARELFLRLIEPGVTEQDTTRRRAGLSELELPDADQTQGLREVADAFVTARLLTAGELSGKATIEVSHEALIREWERLGEWLDKARGDIIIQRDVSGDAVAWIERGSKPDDDGLYRGAILFEKLAWVQRNVPSKDELAFIEASQRHERRRQRRVQLVRTGVVIMIIVFLLALVAIFSMQNEGLRLEVVGFEVRQTRVAELAPGGVGLVPFGDGISPQNIFATVTQNAALSHRDRQSRVIDMVYKEQYGVEMVQVPAGCFWMGSVSGGSNEQPVHEVCFDHPFWIDRFEVTNKQYTECVDVAICTSPREDYGVGFNGAQQPVVGVTWSQVTEYCAWRDARLPTEAEWEYAARGPDSLVYPWGNEFVEKNVVYYANADGPADVGQDQRSGGVSWVGVYDMSGNVWEWVADHYDSSYYSTFEEMGVNPQGPDEETSMRSLRGGSFWDNHSDPLRGAYRFRLPFDDWKLRLGFRCARFD